MKKNATYHQKKAENYNLLSTLIFGLFIFDSFALKLLTNISTNFPLWICLITLLGGIFVVFASGLQNYIIKQKKITGTDTPKYLLSDMLGNIFKITLSFSISSASIANYFGVNFSNCNDNSLYIAIQIYFDRILKMITLDILDISQINFTECKLNQHYIPILIVVSFHLLCAYIVMPYIVTVLRFVFGEFRRE